jgi:16S rRNA (cytidine1402-2'-O)-methyltransferase
MGTGRLGAGCHRQQGTVLADAPTAGVSGTRPGRLFLVATPIGNLEDITLRALRVLREADEIAAEDTRRTRKLLAHYDIHTPLRSYRSRNVAQAAGPILDLVAEGRRIALVTDSGLPGVSDPGREILAMARERGLAAEVVPGPSAAVAAFVAAGFPGEGFTFVGYLPSRGADRRRLLEELARIPSATVAFEAPHRLPEALGDIASVLGGDRRVAVVRELTKLHEEVFTGSAREAAERFEAHAAKGEITLVIAGAEASHEEPVTTERAQALAQALAEAGLAPSEVVRLVSTHLGVRRAAIYAQLRRPSGG